MFGTVSYIKNDTHLARGSRGHRREHEEEIGWRKTRSQSSTMIPSCFSLLYPLFCLCVCPKSRTHRGHHEESKHGPTFVSSCFIQTYLKGRH